MIQLTKEQHMSERPYAKIQITEKGERALRGRHPWVYSDEVTALVGEIQNGDIVDVYSQKWRWLGAGFYNDHSKLRVRIVSRNPNDRFEESFWERRLRYAIDYRLAVMGEDFSCCRLVFGESDGLPGLTVDRFEDILVTQCVCYGMEQRKQAIYPMLVSILNEKGIEIRGIYERNDLAVRAKEGLEQTTGFFLGSGDGHVTIRENGILFDVDYFHGQKTGYFLDQKYNRKAIWPIAKDHRVLDCFTHTGAFALNCAMAGAASVTAVDVSDDALSTARHNAELNGLNVSFLCADVFDLLTEKFERKERDYDFIILDPPAFTKSSSTVKNAIRGYKDINYRAMKLLPRGGYLATCSCSHFMTDDLFRKMLHSAAKDADVTLKQIEARQQSPDHPISWDVPETDYLKFYIFQVV